MRLANKGMNFMVGYGTQMRKKMKMSYNKL